MQADYRELTTEEEEVMERIMNMMGILQEEGWAEFTETGQTFIVNAVMNIIKDQKDDEVIW